MKTMFGTVFAMREVPPTNAKGYILSIKTVSGVLAVSLLTVSAAHASVVYNWHSQSSGTYANANDGRIEVTDRAYQAGSMAVHFDKDYFIQNDNYGMSIGGQSISDRYGGPGQDAVLNSPLLYASMGFGFGGSPYTGEGASIQPRQPAEVPYKTFNLDLTFNEDDTLSGTFNAFGFLANFDSAGTGRNWQVSDVNSDLFNGLGHCTGNEDEPCSGGTGYWLRATETDVPAPSSWGLFGLALGLIGWAGRRRCSAKSTAR